MPGPARDRLPSSVTPSVLVLDGEQRAALAVVRSLGRRGCRVQVASSVRRSLAGGSRFAAGESLTPDPLESSPRYADAVTGLAIRHRVDLVVPVTEPSTLALLEAIDRTTGVRLPVAGLERFRRAADKPAVLALAATLGIQVPEQWAVTGPGDIPPIPADRFPLVVKPARSVAGESGKRWKVGVRYATSAARLHDILVEFGTGAGPFLLQEKIEGPGVGIFLLRWGGRIIASFAHRRIREKPPSGGVSVCCESIPAPADLVERSATLLAELDWEGVAMVEYKHDRRSGRNCLMEINPRFWGSLQLAIDAGVDFPWYLTTLALGGTVEPVHQWRTGIRSRWWLGEIDHLIARLRRSKAALNLPPDAPGLPSAIVTALTPWRPRQRNDVLRLSDPMPSVREGIAWLQELRSR